MLCCHPAVSPASQLALTLRAVGGLTTAEIASAFLVPEATMAQRISRAKAAIKAAGAAFGEVGSAELTERIGVVRQVLYLVFNEGYASSAGERAQRTELTAEAIRLTRMLLAASGALPGAIPETAGLLALMLLTDARRAARERSGELIPLAEQDRTLWDAGQIAEGVSLIERTLGTGAIGPYQVQAAIAAVHDEAATDAATDWPQILALYEVLEGIAPGPVVTLNRAVARRPRRRPARRARPARNPRRRRAARALAPPRRGARAPARARGRSASRRGRRTCVPHARTGSVPEQRYLALRAAHARLTTASRGLRLRPGRRTARC